MDPEQQREDIQHIPSNSNKETLNVRLLSEVWAGLRELREC